MIDMFKIWNPNIYFENIIHMDLEAEENTVLGLRWLLGTVTDLVYSKNCIDERDIIAQFMSDIQILETLCISLHKYNEVFMYLNICVCVPTFVNTLRNEI